MKICTRVLVILLLLFSNIVFCTIASAQDWEHVDPTIPVLAQSNKQAIAEAADGTKYIAYLKLIDADNNNTPDDTTINVLSYNIVTGWTDLGEVAPLGNYKAVDIALDGNIPYVGYTSSEGFLRVMAFTAGWQQVFIDETTFTGTIQLKNNNGKIYLAQLLANGLHILSMTPGVSNWEAVGDFIPDGNGPFSLAFDNNNIPYILYIQDDVASFTNDNLFIKKLEGTTWVQVGNTISDVAYSSLFLPNVRIIFDNANTPYISYSLEQTNFPKRISKLNNNTWEPLGNSFFALKTSLACLNNQLFIAYGDDDVTPHTLTVKRWTGTAWEDVGTTYISDGNVFDNDLIPSANNHLAVAYNDQVFSFAGPSFTVVYNLHVKTFDASALLPVVLKSFNITKQNNSSLVQWVTSTEINNAGFDIQYGTDGKNFITVATIPAAVNGNQENHYSYVHSGVKQGMNYYRLAQKDKDGKINFSQIASTQFSQSELVTVSIHPNPAKDIVQIQHNIQGSYELIIVDAAGKIVQQAKGNTNVLQLNITTLSGGTFWITIKGEKGSVNTSFIK